MCSVQVKLVRITKSSVDKLYTRQLVCDYITYGHLGHSPPNPNGVSSLWVGNVKPEVSGDKLLAMFSK